MGKNKVIVPTFALGSLCTISCTDTMMPILHVLAGGAIGSVLRYLLSSAFPVSTDSLPVGTIIVNLVGSFVLGTLSALSVLVGGGSRDVYLFLGTGLCGGFTTMSTFSMETVNMIDTGNGTLAGIYIILTITGSVLSAYAGVFVARWIAS